jgi:hypothetical protein
LYSKKISASLIDQPLLLTWLKTLEMEPAEDIWDDFHVFRGDSMLTKDLLFKKVGEGNLQANVKWFWTWIDTLHASLLNNEDVGISSSAQAGDVLALLKRFFPLPTSPNQ